MSISPSDSVDSCSKRRTQESKTLQDGFKIGFGVSSSEAIGVRQLRRNSKWNEVLILRACLVIPAFVAAGVFLERAWRHIGRSLPPLAIVVFGALFLLAIAQSIHWTTMLIARNIPLTLAVRLELPVLRLYQDYRGMIWGPVESLLQCLSCHSRNPNNGLVVYDASVVFIAMLASDAELRKRLPDIRILELGAGVGAVSMALAQLGAKQVVATDIEINAVKAIQRNIKANELGERCLAQCFGFGDEAGPLCKGGRFDLIISADTIHFVNGKPALQDALAQSLVDCCTSNGEVLLIFESRGFVWAESQLCRRLVDVFDVEELELDGMHNNTADEENAWIQFLQHPRHEWIREDSRLMEKMRDTHVMRLRRRPTAMESGGLLIGGENQASPAPPDCSSACHFTDLEAQSALSIPQ